MPVGRLAYAIPFLAILGVAAMLRLPQLELRPMHTDEAVHAVKLEELWRTGRYVYDPEEYHGPTLYYATLPVLWIARVGSFAEFREAHLRIVPVLFGLGLIALLPLVADGLGRRATVAAGLLTALSTAFTFYSRYYIQETLLVFFTFLTIAAGWRYVRSRRTAWALLAGLGVGMMHATKETCIIAWACMAAALLGCVAWQRFREDSPLLRSTHVPDAPTTEADGASAWNIARDGRAVLLACAAAVLVSVAFYSAFLTDPQGPWNSVRTFATYFDRAGSHGLHNHPWHFYLERLLYFHRAPGPRWSEAVIVALAALGFVAAIRGRRPSRGSDGHETAARSAFQRFLAFYTLLMTLVYCAIAYKTTWCMLGFLHGMILLAGVGVGYALDVLGQRSDPQTPRRLPTRAVAVAALLVGAAGIVHLPRQTGLANTKFYADNRNPYVYAHPVNGVKELSRWVDRLASVSPEGRRTLIRVFTPDAWPIPWYLRAYEHVGYWETVPQDCEAPIVIAWPEFTDELDARLGDRYQRSHYGLRPGLVLTVYARRDLYDAFVERQLR